MIPDSVHSIFVYGTLQQGQERASCWPCPPRAVYSARVRGALYDLGPYPALVEGDDWIGGERWEIAPGDLQRTLEVLDEIEGFAGQADDLYLRQVLLCHDETGCTHQAFTYIYARLADLASARRITPVQDAVCRWHAAR